MEMFISKISYVYKVNRYFWRKGKNYKNSNIAISYINKSIVVYGALTIYYYILCSAAVMSNYIYMRLSLVLNIAKPCTLQICYSLNSYCDWNGKGPTCAHVGYIVCLDELTDICAHIGCAYAWMS